MSQLRNRGSNVWQVGIYLGKDDDGKKKTHYETFYGTKSQAKLYASKLEVELKQKMNVPKSQELTINNLFDDFLKFKRDKIERSTFEQYERHINKLRDLIGDLYLYGLEFLPIEEGLKRLNETRLSPRTIKNHYTTLKTVMKWGSVRKVVPQNIMVGIQPPKIEHITRNVLNEGQLIKFIETAKTYKHYLPIKLLALTGMRVGEVMGLKWRNIDLGEGRIKIVEAVNSHLKYLKDTKTKNSKREIYFDEEIIGELILYKQKMLETHKITDDDFVFKTDESGILPHHIIFRTKERILKKSGLQHIRIHDLRHGVGSIMLDNGSSITAVAEQLGQVPATTAGNYSHALRSGRSIAHLIAK